MATRALCGNSSQQVRVVLIKCKGIGSNAYTASGQAVPTYNTLFQMANSANLTVQEQFQPKLLALPAQKENFTILYDKIFQIATPVATTAEVGEKYSFQDRVRIKADHWVMYSGTSASNSNVIAGQMYLLAFTDSSTANPTAAPGIQSAIVWEYESN